MSHQSIWPDNLRLSVEIFWHQRLLQLVLEQERSLYQPFYGALKPFILDSAFIFFGSTTSIWSQQLVQPCCLSGEIMHAGGAMGGI